MNVRIAISLFTIAWVYDLKAGTEDQTVKIPDDGWWIRYSSVQKAETNGQIREFTRKLTYSLVGTVVEDGATCRWLELKKVFLSGKTENVEIVEISKLLLLEKDLLEREQPLEALKRGWMKAYWFDDVQALKPEVDKFSTELIVFPNVWQKADRLDAEKVVDFQQGRMTIPQARVLKETMPGRPRNDVNEEPKNVIERTAWFDRKTAPVFATAKFQSKVYVNDELRRTFEDVWVIEDTGKDAKSQLPDNN